MSGHRLCEQVLGPPELADDPRFATNAARVAARAELHREIEAALSPYSPDKVLALLDAAQIANGRLNTVGDLLVHPQLEHRWAEVGSPAGPVRALPPPVSTGGAAPWLGPIPAVGEHRRHPDRARVYHRRGRRAACRRHRMTARASLK